MREIREGCGIGLWKEIRKEWELLSTDLMFLIGDGRRIIFWKDIWCDEEALNTAFPAMFDLVIQKDAIVAYVWDNISEVRGWSPCSSRSFDDWEVEEVPSNAPKQEGSARPRRQAIDERD